jgi:SAM-dependent methyltransferase
MQAFLELFAPGPETSILDVGGTDAFWIDLVPSLQVTILNISPKPDRLPPNLTYVQGSATSLPFSDGSFDVVFSNSMIEHLHDRASQALFALEALRVGRGVWVQTPARWFPIEPHLLTPLIHYLPKRLQRRLLRNFTVWGLITRPDQSYVDGVLDEIALLTASDMRALFPGCELRRERLLGLTKSLIAIVPPRP